MKLLRSISVIGGYTIGSRAFGFIREVLTAGFLGASAASDALGFAIKLPSFFRRLFAEGALNASFIPLFAGLLATKSKDEAITFAEQVLTLLVTVLLVLVVIVELALPTLLPVLVPGFKETPERLHYAIQFCRITFPFIFFISLTALFSGILNSFHRFVAAASSPMAGNALILAVVWGLYDHFSSPGYAFAWGILACGILQFLWVYIPVRRTGMRLGFVWPTMTPTLKKFFKIMAPAALGGGIVQINLFIGGYIASWLPVGAMSYMSYADRLNQLPLSVIGVAVSTALLPLLSKQNRGGLTQDALESQNFALEFSLLFVMPAAAVLIAMADPLISVVFERGAFTESDRMATALTLQAFALGLPAYVLIKVFSTTFFAHQDTRTPIRIAVLAIVIDIALSIWLMGLMLQVGIALATAISAWINAVLMGWVLWRRRQFQMSEGFKRFMPRIILTTIFTGFGAYGLVHLLHPFMPASELLRDLFVVGEGIAVIGLYLLLSFTTGAARVEHLKIMMKKDFTYQQ